MAVQTRIREQKMYPLMDAREKLLIWEHARQVWSAHKWSTGKELEKKSFRPARRKNLKIAVAVVMTSDGYYLLSELYYRAHIMKSD